MDCHGIWYMSFKSIYLNDIHFLVSTAGYIFVFFSTDIHVPLTMNMVSNCPQLQKQLIGPLKDPRGLIILDHLF